jgi:hypothetical protein
MTPGPRPAAWTCPSCGLRSDATPTAFCAACGEQRLGVQAPVFLSAWQRWKHSLWALARHPGRLTADWSGGRRRSQVAPLSLFLAINVVFFITQSLSGLSVVSIPLQAHLHDQPHAAVARDLLDRRLAKLGQDRERFGERFDLQQQTLAKASIITMVLPMALMCGLLFRSRPERFATHWAFALHFHACAMMFLIVFFIALGLVLHFYTAMHWTIEADHFDALVSSIQFLTFGGYLYGSARCVYGVGKATGAIASLVLLATLVAALYAHRFGVFAVTLHTA